MGNNEQNTVPETLQPAAGEGNLRGGTLQVLNNRLVVLIVLQGTYLSVQEPPAISSQSCRKNRKDRGTVVKTLSRVDMI